MNRRLYNNQFFVLTAICRAYGASYAGVAVLPSTILAANVTTVTTFIPKNVSNEQSN